MNVCSTCGCSFPSTSKLVRHKQSRRHIIREDALNKNYCTGIYVQLATIATLKITINVADRNCDTGDERTDCNVTAGIPFQNTNTADMNYLVDTLSDDDTDTDSSMDDPIESDDRMMTVMESNSCVDFNRGQPVRIIENYYDMLMRIFEGGMQTMITKHSLMCSLDFSPFSSKVEALLFIMLHSPRPIVSKNYEYCKSDDHFFTE